LKKTPLYDMHVAAGGEAAAFAQKWWCGGGMGV
jgi:hypothetical protein